MGWRQDQVIFTKNKLQPESFVATISQTLGFCALIGSFFSFPDSHPSRFVTGGLFV